MDADDAVVDRPDGVTDDAIHARSQNGRMRRTRVSKRKKAESRPSS